MVQLKPFEVEVYMDEHEHDNCIYNLSETCCDSISLETLSSFSSDGPPLDAFQSKRMTYGDIGGSKGLRNNITALYEADLDYEKNVLVTPGAIAANFLVLYSLVKPGDHVICMHPTYQQLYSIPEQLGASVSLWHLTSQRRGDHTLDWSLDLHTLDDLCLTHPPSLIILNNPNNPTGKVFDKTFLESVITIARQHGDIPILCDEVYRPIFQPDVEQTPPSIVDLYENGIATSSLSKAYSLAGIRTGWICSQNTEYMERFAQFRHFNTISLSMLSDAVATRALSGSVRPKLVQRNLNLAQTNRQILLDFVKSYSQYVECSVPQGGTTVLIRLLRDGYQVDDSTYCGRLQKETGVMLVPAGRCFDFPGFVRMGYCCSTEELKEGLEKWGEWLKNGRAMDL